MERLLFGIHGHVYLFEKEFSQSKVFLLFTEHIALGGYRSKTDRNIKLLSIDIIVSLKAKFDLLKLFGKKPFLPGDAVEDRDELVTSEARGKVAGRDFAGKPSREFGENLVSCDMSISIVDLLEVV